MLKRIPTWPRLFILLLLGAPLVDLGIITQWAPDDPISRIEAVTAYSVFLWTFIAINTGLDKFFSYVSTAAVMVVATVIVGAVVRQIFGLGGDSPKEVEQVSEHFVGILLMLMVSLPYVFFIIQSFSVSKLLERIHKGAERPSNLRLHVAVCLRVFQHLAETIPALFSVWCEEHPERMFPRNRTDWHTQGILKLVAQFIDWFWNAFWLWAKCLFVFSLRIVPSVNNEARRCYTRARLEN
jgi:hypothetical protein